MSGSSASAPAGSYLVSDMVAFALRQIGVGAQGTTPAASDLSDGVLHLNNMLAQWQRRRWLVPALVEIIGLATGSVDMLVGPGLDIDVPQRPDKIEAAFARYLGNGLTQADFASVDFSPDFLINNLDEAALALDYPLGVINSREDYAQISIKNLRTFPSFCFYSPEYPNGRLNVWPVPQKGLWEIHLVTKGLLPSNLALTNTIVLAPEYYDAILWNLALRLAPSYGQEGSPTVAMMAKGALQTIRTANVQVPSLTLPVDLGSRTRGSIPAPFVQAGFY